MMNGCVKVAPRLLKQHKVSSSQQVQDADGFELNSLISDIDDDIEQSSPTAFLIRSTCLQNSPRPSSFP